ncbi:MAG: GNAT family N-acetyltransferase [Myxococcales bacterium]|nr:GNAT family N-acetyltransferase [Myxococcales bacterium]
MTPPECLESSRLILRPPGQEDAPAIFDGYARDPEVVRYLTWPVHRDLGDTRAFLDSAERDWTRGKSFTWALTERGDDTCLGMVGFRPEGFRGDMGYVLRRDRWGRGYMSEAAGRLLDWLKAQPELYRVSAVCDVDNHASARVMEKIGMQYEGIQRRAMRHNIDEEPRDVKSYAWARA